VLTPINVKPKGYEKIAYHIARFDPSGQGIFFTSDEGSEFVTLKYFNWNDGSINNLTGHIPWDVESFQVSRFSDGPRLGAFTTNEDGISILYIIDLHSFQITKVNNVPVGVINSLYFNERQPLLGMVINSATSTGDISVFSTKTGSLQQWTFSEIGGLPNNIFITPTLIRFPTFDPPRTIPAFFYLPTRNPHKNQKFPVVISIHGGPESQVRPTFSPLFQFLVNEMGVAVIDPNVRGSSGYGKTYLLMDNGYKREDSVKDIGKLIEWIGEQSHLDKDRIAVFGGSYGGYMVLASLIHFGEKLRCGVEMVGISNFVTFLESTQEYRRDQRRTEYGDERDPKMREFLTSISPLTNAHKIIKPLYVGQGLNDPRVPISEANQIVAAARKNNVPVWYVIAKDEGHGFAKKVNRDFYLNSLLYFLELHLLNG